MSSARMGNKVTEDKESGSCVTEEAEEAGVAPSTDTSTSTTSTTTATDSEQQSSASDEQPSLVIVKTEPESESTAGSDHGGDDSSQTSQSDNTVQSATLPPR